MAAPDITKNRADSIDNAISQIQRQFGKGSIMRLGSHETERIPVVCYSQTLDNSLSFSFHIFREHRHGRAGYHQKQSRQY